MDVSPRWGRKCRVKQVYGGWASQVTLVVKKPPASAEGVRDMGSIPGSERSPGGGHGNLLQYSCLENSMDREAWRTTVHGITKSWTQLNTHTQWFEATGLQLPELRYSHRAAGRHKGRPQTGTAKVLILGQRRGSNWNTSYLKYFYPTYRVLFFKLMWNSENIKLTDLHS